MTYPNRVGPAGFTLIELLVAMALAGIILGAITTGFISQQRHYDAQEQMAEMVQSARAAMDMISREVRMAGYNPARVSFSGITYSATQFQIKADLNGDGDTGDTNENIIYTYDSPNLRIDRDTGGGGQPFAENITAFTFSYLDSGGSATTSSASVRQVGITITARTAKRDPYYPANNGYRTHTLSSVVTPKNLGL